MTELPTTTLEREDPLPDHVPATTYRPPSVDRTKPTRVVSSSKSLWTRITQIWARRELLFFLVRTEISVKYKSSFLGVLWSMLSPALNLAVYFLVFQVILKNGIPNFVIFLFSGLLIWNLFQTAVQTATATVVTNSGLVKKIDFPREILAFASVGSAGFFFVFQSLVMLIFMLVLHSAPAWQFMPLLPVALVGVVVVSAGLSVLFSAINVYLRDTQHLVEVLMTAWFWACPIVYGFQNEIGSKLVGWKHIFLYVYFANPLVPLVLTFQRILYAHPIVQSTNPGGGTLELLPDHGFGWYLGLDTGVIVGGLVFLLVSLKIFGRLEGNFAEEL